MVEAPAADADGTAAEASAEPEASAEAAAPEPVPAREFRLATWKQLIDNGVLQRGDRAYASTARPAVVKVSQAVYDRMGSRLVVTGDRGSVTLSAEVADLPDDVVWLPANSFGRGVLADVASPGSGVDLAPWHGGNAR